MPENTSPTHAKTGDTLTGVPTPGGPTPDLDSSNTASTLIESPVPADEQGVKGAKGLKRHDFPEGGGSGGAEAFRRKDQ